MKFLVDAQLPPSLVNVLIGAGLEAEHVTMVGLDEADDGPIWEHAVATGCVVLSKDEDFEEPPRMKDPRSYGSGLVTARTVLCFDGLFRCFPMWSNAWRLAKL